MITGAVRNAGLGMARKFLSEGWNVAITSRVEADAQAKAKELTEEFGVECYGFGFSPLNAKEEVPGLFAKLEERVWCWTALSATRLTWGAGWIR